MADVFLSYKREDRPLCVAVHDALAALRLSVWFDARLELGVRFDKEIEREIHEAAAVLVLWSPQSAASDWVREEALVGRDRECLVSARIAPCTLPMGFKAVQTADIFEGALDGANEDWLQMLERIGKIVGRPGLAEFVMCERAGATERWQAWLVKYRDDPLMPEAVERLAASAGPDLRRRLAEENARRIMLEGQVEEYRATQEGHTNRLKESAEMEKLRRARPPPAPPPAQPTPPPAVPEWERQAQAEAARIAATRAPPRGPPQPAPAPRGWAKGNGPWLLIIGASLLIAATALVLTSLRRGTDRPAPDRRSAPVPEQVVNQAAPASAVPPAPAPARPPREAGHRDYQPIPPLEEENARAAPPPPLFPDSSWSYVATDAIGNVYAVRWSDQGGGSALRRLWVRGDHTADQSIMHRYSMTLWAFNCADQTFALTGRTNYHADGNVDRRPLPNPRVSRAVIAALGAVACR